MRSLPPPRSASTARPCLLLARQAACGSAETTSDTPLVPSCPAIVIDTTVPIEAAPDGSASCAAGDCNLHHAERLRAWALLRPRSLPQALLRCPIGRRATQAKLHPLPRRARR